MSPIEFSFVLIKNKDKFCEKAYISHELFINTIWESGGHGSLLPLRFKLTHDDREALRSEKISIGNKVSTSQTGAGSLKVLIEYKIV